MKSKLFVVIGIFLALGVFFITSQTALAGTWCPTASIDEIGQDKGQSVVYLTDESGSGAFTYKWFQLNPNNKNQMLAVILTAQSLGKMVKVEINDDGLTIDRIRVKSAD